MEDQKQTKNYSNKEQFVISGSNNTINIHNDSSAVKMNEALMAEKKQHSQDKAFAMKMAEQVVDVFKTSFIDYMAKKNAATQKAPSTKRKASVKRPAAKKKGKGVK